MRSLRIVALCVLAAVAYGIVHDQITARICIEYFTIAHPRIVASESPTVLAIVWGIVATWWVGVLLGVPLAFAALHGPRPTRTARSLVRPIAILLAVMATCALGTALVGRASTLHGAMKPPEPFASRIAPERYVPFMTAASAHAASYFVGFVGGIVLVALVWRSRGRGGSATRSDATAS